MIREAVYHRPKNNYAYAYDTKTLHLRLRCKKNDVSIVNLIYGDPYRWAEDRMVSEAIPMRKITSDELFDYWFIAIEPENNRFVYMFELHDGNDTVIYGEKGFTSNIDDNRFFRFPYLNAIDVFDAPSWVKDTVWYQIFPERFANGTPEGKSYVNGQWGDDPQEESFFGGDLKGITENLDYLADLGITGIYLNPIFESPTNHKYDTTDYLKIDPQFGDAESFRTMVKECHARGIRVMLDAVFNHCGYGFAPFQDVLKNGAKSRYADWFHITDFGGEGEHPTYETFAFVPEMPKFNTTHPEVKEYLLKVSKYWIEEFDIDGWRLDVANEIDHKFWREFRNTVRSVKEDLYIIAEVWNDAMPWLQGDQFDSVMNYPYTEAVIDFVAKDKIGAKKFAYEVISHLELYPDNVNEAMFNLLGSHDTARILTECGHDKDRLKLAFLLLFSYPGTPCIYYGDEVGLDGDGPTFAYYRKCMEWDAEKQDQDLLAFTKRLIKVRTSNSAFTDNARFGLLEASNDTGVLVFTRGEGKGQIIVALNSGDAPVNVVLPSVFAEHTITDVWSEGNEVLGQETLSFTLDPKQFRILGVE